MNTNNTLTVTKYFKGLGKAYTLGSKVWRLSLEGSIEPIQSKGFITTTLYHFQLS